MAPKARGAADVAKAKAKAKVRSRSQSPGRHGRAARATASAHSVVAPVENIPKPAEADVLEKFLRFDRDGDGFIDHDDLAFILKVLDEDLWTDERLHMLKGAIDKNADGRIDVEEFVRWIFHGGSDGNVSHTAFCEALESLPTDEVIQKYRSAAEAATYTETVESAAAAVEFAILPLLGSKERESAPTTFHLILDSGLFLGGRSVSADELHSVGITHVVRILENLDDFVLPRNTLEGFLSVQAADVVNSDLRPHFAQAQSFIFDAMAAGGKVYVHCAQGRSRSCTMVLSYLILQEKMSLRDAFIHVLKRRDVSAINIGFLAQLVDLEEEVHGVVSLPLLAAFIVKQRWNKDIAFDKSQVFNVAEILNIWLDPKAQTRDPCRPGSGMAMVQIRSGVRNFAGLLNGEVSEDVNLAPLQTRCLMDLRLWLKKASGKDDIDSAALPCDGEIPQNITLDVRS